jgi:potassium channel subfamily K
VKQRSVVINVMLLLCYAAIGGLVYSYTIGGLTFEDALYLSIVSVTTVGFGDLSPNNTGSRIFSLFYNTIGIILLAVTIATTRESIIESFEISYRKRREAIAEKADQRREAKKRIMALRAEAAEKLGLPEPPTPRIQRRRTSLAFAAVKHRSNSWWARCRKRLVKMGIFKSRHEEEVDKRITDRSLRRKGSMDSTLSSTEDQFDAFREKLMREERRDGTLKLVVVFGLFVVFWLVGAAVGSSGRMPQLCLILFAAIYANGKVVLFYISVLLLCVFVSLSRLLFPFQAYC